MTKLSTRVEEIFEIEGFKIVALNDDGIIDPAEHGVLDRYDYQKCLPDSKYVADWKRLRFHPLDESNQCHVLYADGDIADELDTLESVRGSYV